MYKIRDWLYISNYAMAHRASVVQSYRINAMVQLYKSFQIEGITACYVQAVDGKILSQVDIKRAMAFVQEQHEQGSILLFTCGAGISRSVTFATAALKEIEGSSLRDSYLAIRAHHPDALPDHMHWDSLRTYYREGQPFWEIWQEIILDD